MTINVLNGRYYIPTYSAIKLVGIISVCALAVCGRNEKLSHVYCGDCCINHSMGIYSLYTRSLRAPTKSATCLATAVRIHGL